MRMSIDNTATLWLAWCSDTTHTTLQCLEDGAAASWSAVPKTDWGSITGKPEVSVEAVPDAVSLRDAEGRLVGNITGTAVYA